MLELARAILASETHENMRGSVNKMPVGVYMAR